MPLSSTPPLSMKIKRFFIIGNPRSGTTLLRLMLNKHSKISVPPEAGFLVWLYYEYKNFSFSKRGVADFIEGLQRTSKIEHWNLNYSDLKRFINNEKPEKFSILMDCVYRYYTEYNLSKSVDIYGDKNNYYLNYIGELHAIYPDVKFLHIVRDGRSVAVSYKGLNKKKLTSAHAPNLPFKIEEIAKEWQDNIMTINNSLSKLDITQHHTVKFEDLVSTPVASLKQICTFLGVDFDENMLNYYKTTQTEGLEPSDFLQWKSKNTKPLLIEEVTKYKELSKLEIDKFEEVANDTLMQYQYN
jgi:sulfotransferase family protein